MSKYNFTNKTNELNSEYGPQPASSNNAPTTGVNYAYYNKDNLDELSTSPYVNLTDFDRTNKYFEFTEPNLLESLKYSLTDYEGLGLVTVTNLSRYTSALNFILSRIQIQYYGLYTKMLSLVNRGTFPNDPTQLIPKISCVPVVTSLTLNLGDRITEAESGVRVGETEIYFLLKEAVGAYNSFLEKINEDLYAQEEKNLPSIDYVVKQAIRYDSVYADIGNSTTVKNDYREIEQPVDLLGRQLTRLNKSKYPHFLKTKEEVFEAIKKLRTESFGESTEFNLSDQSYFIRTTLYGGELSNTNKTAQDVVDFPPANRKLSILLNLSNYITEQLQNLNQSLIKNAIGVIANIRASRDTQAGQPFDPAKYKELKNNIKTGNIDAAKVAADDAIAADAAAALQAGINASAGRDPFELTRFNVQCFMLDYIDRFVDKADEVRKKTYEISPKIPNDGKVVLIKGKSYDLLNKLFGTQNKSKFLDLSNEKLSYLVPKIKLHKVHYGVNGSVPTDYIIPFSTNAGWISANKSSNSIETIYTTETIKTTDPYIALSDREFGVGIKSFNWDYEGSNPVSARKDISATLTLKALNFDALCRQFEVNDESGNSKINFRYIDLILRSGPKFYQEDKDKIKQSVFSARNSKYNPHYFTYRIDLGFQQLLQNNGLPVSFKLEEIQAVNENNVTLSLTLIDHKFSFNQDGTINLEIKYRAYFEAVMNDNEADILATKEILEARGKREEELQKLQEACEGFEEEKEKEEAQAELKKVYEQFAKIEFQELKSSYGRIVQSLRDKKKINYALVDKAKLGGYAINGRYAAFTGGSTTTPQDLIDFNPPVTPPSLVNNPTPPPTVSSTDKKEEIQKKISEFLQKNAPVEDTNGKILISYFFLSDLIEIMVDNIINVVTANSVTAHINAHTKIVLGSVTVEVNGRNESISLGDIPISVDYFSEWFLNRVVAEKRSVYHLLTFLRDIASHMITDLFGSKCAAAYNRTPNKIQMTNFILRSSGENYNQEFFAANIARSDYGVFDFGSSTTNDLVDLIRLNRSTIQAIASKYLFHYTMIYALSTIEKEERNPNDIEADNKLGIYHIGYGRNKGIVKKLDFERTEIKGLRELNFIREFDGRGLSQLQSTYNANVTTVGSYLFFPGERVYIDPTGFGNSIGSPNQIGSVANQLGLGGYHYIYRVNNSITPGKFETTFKAKWESSGVAPAGKGNKLSPQKNVSGRPSSDLGNCLSVSSRIIAEYAEQVKPIEQAGNTIKDAESGLIKPVTGTDEEKKVIEAENARVTAASEELREEIASGKVEPNLSTEAYQQKIQEKVSKDTPDDSSSGLDYLAWWK